MMPRLSRNWTSLSLLSGLLEQPGANASMAAKVNGHLVGSPWKFEVFIDFVIPKKPGRASDAAGPFLENASRSFVSPRRLSQGFRKGSSHRVTSTRDSRGAIVMACHVQEQPGPRERSIGGQAEVFAGPVEVELGIEIFPALRGDLGQGAEGLSDEAASLVGAAPVEENP